MRYCLTWRAAAREQGTQQTRNIAEPVLFNLLRACAVPSADQHSTRRQEAQETPKRPHSPHRQALTCTSHQRGHARSHRAQIYYALLCVRAYAGGTLGMDPQIVQVRHARTSCPIDQHTSASIWTEVAHRKRTSRVLLAYALAIQEPDDAPEVGSLSDNTAGPSEESTGGLRPSTMLANVLNLVPEMQQLSNVSLQVLFNKDSSRVG